MHIIPKPRAIYGAEATTCFGRAPFHHFHCGRCCDRSEHRPYRTSKAPLRFMGLRRSLGAVLVLAVQVVCIQALQGVTLAWDRSPDPTAVGYKMYYGVARGSYTSTRDVGNGTSTSITGLSQGTTYYFAVTAYNTAGLESGFSNEVGYSVPTSSSPPTVTMTVPGNGTSSTAPATINLAASVTANGHSISKVQFYNGGTLLSEDTSAPYSFTWSNVGAGSYGLTARAVYAAGSTVSSSTVSISVTGLPAPWQTTHIGSSSAIGSASVANGVYTVKGAGNLSGSADRFRFVYQRMSGNGEIKVRLNSMENTGSSARIGVVIRESLTTGSKYAFMGVSPDGRFRWQHRSSTGGSTSSTASITGNPPNIWLRLVRTGNTLYGYRSTDGVTWRRVSSRTISMASNIYVGLAVASGSSSRLNTTTFANVTVVP